MAYVGSYIWQLRQKLGRKKLLTTTVDVLPIDSQGRVKLVYSKECDRWSTVGGHVEEGDSFASAALNELREEAGILAEEEALTLFATLSGPGRVYHYPDGDTQPFTLVFFINCWNDETNHTDTSEISTCEWFSFDDALKLTVNQSTRDILDAYRIYLNTGTVQMIEQ
jgi:hydrolase, NUDIX family